MKVAIYTISKNEVKNVDAYMASTKGADCVCITDTGSTDGTVERLKELGATVHQSVINPWRFDNARNASLANVPEDIDWCISLDLDERLCEGWREKLESAISKGVTRIRYNYIWSWKKTGVPDKQFLNSRIHLRRSYKFFNPTHEVLKWNGAEKEIYANSEITIEHHPDINKPRHADLELLEIGKMENPEDDRGSHYLAREYYFRGLYQKAIDEFKRHLSLRRSNWGAERASSLRYMAICYRYLGNLKEARSCLMKACAEDPGRREPWLELAMLFYSEKDFIGTYFASEKGLSIKNRDLSYESSGEAWNERLYDLASISAWNLGMKDKAKEYIKKAVEINTEDDRLNKNLELMLCSI